VNRHEMPRREGSWAVRITVFERVGFRMRVLGHSLGAYGSRGRYSSGLLIEDTCPFMAGSALVTFASISAFH